MYVLKVKPNQKFKLSSNASDHFATCHESIFEISYAVNHQLKLPPIRISSTIFFYF